MCAREHQAFLFALSSLVRHNFVRGRQFVVNRILILLLLAGAFARGQSSNAPGELSFTAPATNAPPIWTPTPEQKKLQGSLFFLSVVNELEGTVTHQLSNVDEMSGNGAFTSIAMATCKAGAPAIFRFAVILKTDPDLTVFKMDPVRPLIFVVDGQRATVDSEYPVTHGFLDVNLGKWVETYSCRVEADFLRSLGTAKRVWLRVPFKGGQNYDRTFSAVELQRFAIFARVYLPPVSSPVETSDVSRTNVPPPAILR